MPENTLTCNVCRYPADDPFRQLDDAGFIVFGCVDECHTSHLEPGTSSHNWHHSDEAVGIRQRRADRLREAAYA